MLTQLKEWKGAVEINGSQYDSIQAISNQFKLDSNEIHIRLYPTKKRELKTIGTQSQDISSDTEYKIFVKPYMTKLASPEFDFMAKFNNDNPMPYRLMVGKKIRETKGMVYMELHADITEKQATICMCCGRALTNPVSQYFGIGPECGGHNYVNPFDTQEELEEAVNVYRQKLREVTWTGWIIKSAIISEEVI